jgi:hypothetical protein
LRRDDINEIPAYKISSGGKTAKRRNCESETFEIVDRKRYCLLDLDLSGFTVLAEADSGPYVVTPFIAVLAGADRVLSITRDSQYAKPEEVIAQTRALEVLCELEDRVEIYTVRSLDLFAEADIVTNLGFVRPIDTETVAAMKPTAIIPLMCETWEFGLGDVDLGACRSPR